MVLPKGAFKAKQSATLALGFHTLTSHSPVARFEFLAREKKVNSFLHFAAILACGLSVVYDILDITVTQQHSLPRNAPPPRVPGVRELVGNIMGSMI